MDRGEYSFALPTTYYDKNSNRSCLGVRVGDSILGYRDWTEFKAYMEDVHVTSLSETASEDATTLTVASTADFDSAGTLHIYSSNTLYTITYTGKTSTTFTGCSGVDAELASGLNVWQGESESKPDRFTIADGYIYLWPLADATYQGDNIKMDYYTDIVEVDSESDEITLARFDMVKHWTKWVIRNITENNGKPDYQDGDWIMFNTCLTDAIRRESSGQKFKNKVKINTIAYRNNRTNNFDTE
jgi:hypothetical protein